MKIKLDRYQRATCCLRRKPGTLKHSFTKGKNKQIRVIVLISGYKKPNILLYFLHYGAHRIIRRIIIEWSIFELNYKAYYIREKGQRKVSQSDFTCIHSHSSTCLQHVSHVRSVGEFTTPMCVHIYNINVPVDWPLKIIWHYFEKKRHIICKERNIAALRKS